MTSSNGMTSGTIRSGAKVLWASMRSPQGEGKRWILGSVVCVLLSWGSPLLANETELSLSAFPESLVLEQPYGYRQLVVSAEGVRNGSTQRWDVTRAVEYSFVEGSEGLISISESGLVEPKRNGSGELKITYEGHSILVPIEVSAIDGVFEPTFIQDVNPIISRQGCNAGGCHGSQDGQNGFKLSLRGYDSVFDHTALIDDLSGRRFNRAAPERSLFLTKPTAQVPHVGGQLFAPGEREYETLLAWIRRGAPYEASVPKVESLHLFPEDPTFIGAGQTQQMAILARYSDGSTRDVTHDGFLETNNIEVTDVDDRGVVTLTRTGEAAILARYEGVYTASRITVLTEKEGFAWSDPPQFNDIDRLVDQKLQRIKVLPSALCDDSEFMRRVTLDLIGLPPSAREVRTFLMDSRSSRVKRHELVDRLIGSAEFVDHWTNKWADLLQVNPKFLGKEGAEKYLNWIRTGVASNVRYDAFVRDLLTSEGSTYENPSTSYFKVLREPDLVMENTTQLFLGIRFNCNKCHDHPFERWTQQAHWKLAAYFSQVDRQNVEGSPVMPKLAATDGPRPSFEEMILDAQAGELKHPDTGEVVAPGFPYQHPGTPVSISADLGRRESFAQWLVAEENPYFARSYVNRLWSYFMGVGLIEPIDDVRASNPPSNPELLNWLTDEFVSHGFDTRHLMRTICQSRVYQQSGKTNEWNENDRVNYSHAIPRRLPAETLFDAVHQAAGIDARLPGQFRGTRASGLSDPRVGPSDGFLELFGRPPRESACECERSSGVSLGQTLNLVNGPTLAQAIRDPRNAIADLVAIEKEDEALLEELYLSFLSRFPRAEELADLTPVLDPGRIENAASLSDADYEKLTRDREAYEKGLRFFDWESLRGGTLISQQGATLQVDAEGAFLVSGANPEKDVYQVVLHHEGLGGTGLRLEVLPHSSLVSQGPGRAVNGNFVLTDFKVVEVPLADPSHAQEVKLTAATADFSQAGWPVKAAIDNNKDSGWAVMPKMGEPHVAYFEAERDLGHDGGSLLIVSLHQAHGTSHTLGRFRLSVTKGERPVRYHGLPDSIRDAIRTVANQRTPEQQGLLFRHFIEKSPKHAELIRLGAAQDIAWALSNSSAFLFNH